jgi:peptidoglycan hydrolase-like protein with peptidoglycan-binding domain
MNVKVNTSTFPLPYGHAFGLNDFTGKRHNGFVLGYKRGDAPTTDDQRNIQKIQTFLGVEDSHGGADGYFSEKTAEYVKRWQYSERMNPTGVVDQETWEAMCIE